MRRIATPILASLLASLLVFAVPAGAATRRTPTLAPTNTVIDGPSANIVSLNGLAVARDGTGGLVYVKNVGGVPHVFESTLLAGSFHAPVQLDQGLGSASSQPVIAATNGGVVVVAFINAGELYAVEKPSASSSWGPLVPIFAGATNPSISMSMFGKAYLAFTALSPAGDNVRCAYFYAGTWGLEPTSLNATPNDDAGTGTGAPQVATSGDGTASVVWGENGHIYLRRVLGTAGSIEFEQADPPSISGWNEVSATDPQISSGGDSSYAAVAFEETVSNGVSQQTRVLVNRLQAEQFDGATGADGLITPEPESGSQPRVAVTEFGAGFVTTAQSESDNVFATTLGDNEAPTGGEQVNSLFAQSAPDAVPAVAGTVSTLIAWQQNPGSMGVPEIRVRYAPNGSDLNPEEVVSSPSLGPTDADRGLFAGGDLSGDAAIAGVQGTGSQSQIVAGQLFQTPGGITPSKSTYSNSVTPTFSWSASSELWGPPTYTVKVGGVVVGSTTATTLRSVVPLSQGRHTWQVTATNLAGLTNSSRTATVFVDSIPPRVLAFRITGRHRVGDAIHVYANYTDTPRGGRRSQASGVSSVQIKWGDGKKSTLTHNAVHVYSRRGRFTVTLTVKDRAGNKTIKKRKLRISK